MCGWAWQGVAWACVSTESRRSLASFAGEEEARTSLSSVSQRGGDTEELLLTECYYVPGMEPSTYSEPPHQAYYPHFTGEGTVTESRLPSSCRPQRCHCLASLVHRTTCAVLGLCTGPTPVHLSLVVVPKRLLPSNRHVHAPQSSPSGGPSGVNPCCSILE